MIQLACIYAQPAYRTGRLTTHNLTDASSKVWGWRAEKIKPRKRQQTKLKNGEFHRIPEVSGIPNHISIDVTDIKGFFNLSRQARLQAVACLFLRISFGTCSGLLRVFANKTRSKPGANPNETPSGHTYTMNYWKINDRRVLGYPGMMGRVSVLSFLRIFNHCGLVKNYILQQTFEFEEGCPSAT